MPINNHKAAREAAIKNGLNPATLNKYSNGWEQPTPDDVRLILSLAGLSGSQAGALVGSESRTVRRWTGGDSSIPFACWALLVEFAGLGEIWK